MPVYCLPPSLYLAHALCLPPPFTSPTPARADAGDPGAAEGAPQGRRRNRKGRKGRGAWQRLAARPVAPTAPYDRRQGFIIERHSCPWM